jgi:hypothetical protein
MTYAWPSASTIYRGRCVGTTAAGRRCERWRWITSGEHGRQGWFCAQHAWQDGVEEELIG